MNRLIKILALIICVAVTSTARAQYLGSNRTAAAANTAKTSKYTCSYIVAGYGTACFTKPTNAKNNTQNISNNPGLKSADIETKLYPNPFTNYVTVKFAKKDNSPMPQISIIDATGKTMAANCEISDGCTFFSATIYTTNLKQGRYIIKIFSANQIIALKAVKI